MSPKPKLKLLTATTLALGLSLAAAPMANAAPSSATPEAPADNATCASGQWPAATEGRPTEAKAGATGVFAWHDGTGWHLRATEAGKDKAVFVGHVKADGRIFAIARRTEGRDKVTHIGRPNDATFRFTNFGGVDGIDFRVRCGTKLTLDVAMNGHRLDPSLVFIGAAGTHPDAVPATIHRQA